MPVACLISKKITPKIVEDFIDISIHPKHRKAIITDLKEEYNQIMRKLGFAHQHCKFHLVKNISTNLKPKITEELRKNNPQLSNTKINNMGKNKKDEITDEIKLYLNQFYEIFYQQSLEKAISFIKLIKYELKNFPIMLQNYLNKNFFPEYRKYLVFLEKPFIGKLESTNNKLENYFGNTLDKHAKKIYRTPEAIFDYMARKDGWIENRKKGLTK